MSMWELFQKIQKKQMTPNQCYLLFSLHNKTTPGTYTEEDYLVLENLEYIKDKELTDDGLKVIRFLDNYFLVNKKENR
ncbi:MAG: hypothetical protein CM15mV42_1780 [uncultured marine virus]|nr:MAG: hypothetical protein CM15mV42_1780 [uncultured marine virus]